MDSQYRKHLSKRSSLSMPAVNPFVHGGFNFTLLQKIQICLMSVTIAPIRLFLVWSSIATASLIAYLATFDLPMEAEKPIKGWRSSVFKIIGWIGRFMFFSIGFTSVEIKGKRVDAKEALLCVAAPHSSYLDVLLWFCISPMPSSVSRKENTEVPLFHSLMKMVQPVVVRRDNHDSRQQAIQKIRERTFSSEEGWPQIILFPEGTCTNRKALITFKAGAFIPGVPVQPVLLRYPDSLDTFSWTMDGPGVFKTMWLTMCQFRVRFQVEFLPVYHPSEEEKSNPKLYAENVRHMMADALGVPCTDHTFEDTRLMHRAKCHNLPMAAGIVEFSKLNKKLGIGINDMKALLDEFAAISQSCVDGKMGIEEFAQHLKLPITQPLQSLFSLYDRDNSGNIDFREYVIGMSLVSHSAVTEKTVKLAFHMFDQDGDGFVSEEELDKVLKSVFGPDLDTRVIYHELDVKGLGKVDYGQFYAFAKKRPEYAKLFESYAETDQKEFPEESSHVSSSHIRSSRVHPQDEESSPGSSDEALSSKAIPPTKKTE